MGVPDLRRQQRRLPVQGVLERLTGASGGLALGIVDFPQEPGALRRFLDEVLGPNDDITLFSTSSATTARRARRWSVSNSAWRSISTACWIACRPRRVMSELLEPGSPTYPLPDRFLGDRARWSADTPRQANFAAAHLRVKYAVPRWFRCSSWDPALRRGLAVRQARTRDGTCSSRAVPGADDPGLAG